MKNIFILYFLLIQSLMSAQVYNFNEFKYQDLDVKALQISGGLGGFVSASRSESNFSTIPLELSYFRFKNKVDHQSLFNCFISPGLQYVKSVSAKSLLIKTNASIKNEYRKYFKPNKYFEIDLNLRNQYESKKTFQTNSIETEYNLQNEIGFRYGHGRIESIRNFFLGNFIMEDLMKENIIQEPFTQEGLFEFGIELTRLANLRSFDLRVRNKQQIKEICNFLQRHFNIPQEKLIDMFSVVQDNWFQALVFNRESGKRCSIGISPFFNKDKFVFAAVNSYIIQKQGVQLQFEAISSIAKSKSTQIDLLLKLGGFTSFETTTSFGITKNKYFGPVANLTSMYRVFPNSRTSHSLSFNLNYTNNIKFDSSYKSLSINSNLLYVLDYLINYHLRLNLNIGGNLVYRKSSLTGDKIDNYFCNGNIVYSIF